jgi:hypothetical protein
MPDLVKHGGNMLCREHPIDRAASRAGRLPSGSAASGDRGGQSSSARNVRINILNNSYISVLFVFISHSISRRLMTGRDICANRARVQEKPRPAPSSADVRICAFTALRIPGPVTTTGARPPLPPNHCKSRTPTRPRADIAFHPVIHCNATRKPCQKNHNPTPDQRHMTGADRRRSP